MASTFALIAGFATAADARGPKLSVDVEAYCGDPADVDPLTGEVFTTNVAVRLTDVSDDNGPVGATVGMLTVKCEAAVPQGRGRPAQVSLGTMSFEDPAFGVLEVTCPLGNLPAGATEWKAEAKASGGDLGRARVDRCEEVPVM